MVKSYRYPLDDMLSTSGRKTLSESRSIGSVAPVEGGSDTTVRSSSPGYRDKAGQNSNWWTRSNSASGAVAVSSAVIAAVSASLTLVL